MLSIRMQRLGRKGYPVYRVVVQDSRQSPSSGKYVALLGNYNPHTKAVNLEKDKAEHFLKHGAQPSESVVRLFTQEKISIPKWVKKPAKQKREIKNIEKLRRNRPAGEEVPATEAQAEEAAEVPAKNQEAESTPAEAENTAENKPAEETPAEAPVEEKPAEAPAETKE